MVKDYVTLYISFALDVIKLRLCNQEHFLEIRGQSKQPNKLFISSTPSLLNFRQDPDHQTAHCYTGAAHVVLK